MVNFFLLGTKQGRSLRVLPVDMCRSAANLHWQCNGIEGINQISFNIYVNLKLP